MRAIDTNVLVRLITRDDPRQTASAESFVENGAWVSTIVLVEATWVLSSVFKSSAKQLSIAIEMLLNHQDLVLESPETVSAALHLFKAKPVLGFSDCLILETARKAGHVPLGTFDKGLAKVAGTHKV